MSNQFFCKNNDRIKKVAASIGINGIDYLEIGSTDQKLLKIYFLHSLQPSLPDPSLPADLKKENFFIEGGARIKNVTVTAINLDSVNNKLLKVTVDKAGDFSIYTLKIGVSPADRDTAPDGYDEQLSIIDFSFKINCPNEFDCATDTECVPDKPYEPDISYMAKDYASFNRLMLDRLSIIMPNWRERNAADLQVALIELLAYAGDHMSYYQDAVATEAYLSTTRRRVSLRRHARLLDYFVHDGCNARVWVNIEVTQGGGADGAILYKGRKLLTNGKPGEPVIHTNSIDSYVNENDCVIFETMHDIKLYHRHNKVSFYTWGDSNCCLPAGSTRATILNKDNLQFAKNDTLVFEEIFSPSSGYMVDADPGHRHAVRLKTIKKGKDKLTNTDVLEIEWYEEDALPFPLCLTSQVENENTPDKTEDNKNEKSVVRGNMVLADYGISRKGKTLLPATVPDNKKYYPRLPETGITSAEEYLHIEQSAAAAIQQDPHKALPIVELVQSQETWKARQDLLGSDRFAIEFVVETELDGSAYIRFGDDIQGRKPLAGIVPEARYRIGNGTSGNVGANAINTVEWNTAGIKKVINPLPATGGTDSESMEAIRQYAPQAFRVQQRAVTAADYIQKTELHPEVQKATAKFYWTGSWYTVYIIIDRKGGKPIDDTFKTEIKAHLEKYRMAGYDLEIVQPQYVPISIVLKVCIKTGYFKANVKKTLVSLFSNGTNEFGENGFFHPDNYTFGQSVYLSAVYSKALSIEGVLSVEIKELKRWAKNPATEITDGLLKVSELEIIRLDNDPNFPENGKIDFLMFGGL